MTALPGLKTREVALYSAEVTVERRADGVIIVRPEGSLGPFPDRITQRLEHWAKVAPDRCFMARRGPDGEWVRLSYSAMLDLARRIGQGLLDRGLSAERPVAILSGNDLDHAALAMACFLVGVPYAPISPAYSLAAKDHAKLGYVLGVLTPGLVFASHGERFNAAIEAAVPGDTEIVLGAGSLADRDWTKFADLARTEPTAAVAQAASSVGPDTIAKFLFTSGSTGNPKAVINTQRMLCANQQQILTAMPFLGETPPVLVDWTPWNHTFGGNHDVGLVLYNGGTLYISDGRPIPGEIERTIQNLREIPTTMYLDVPKGWEEIVPYLRREPELRQVFFSQVKLFFYAGASLAQWAWDALDQIAHETVGERIQMLTGLGSTETAPFAICCRPDTTASGTVGVPAVGVTLKLAPVDGKLEARVKGPNVTPGYWRNPTATEAAFDQEGFLKMGDALSWIDENRPSLGFRFDGRVAEDFKLSSGTWVSVGPLRARLIHHLAPHIRDVVIAGHDRDFLSAIGIPERADLAGNADAMAVIAEELSALAKIATGSSNRIRRFTVLAEPLSIEAGELTDKGSINQRAVLRHRPHLVDALYAEAPPASVLVVS